MPSEKSAIASPGRAAAPCERSRAQRVGNAMRTTGASCSGANVQLVSRDASSTCGHRTLAPVAGERQTYAAAGVSIAKADTVVERLRAAVESTGATGFGAFAGLHPLDDGRLLAASTDSVGTELVLARERGALRACGTTSPRTASTTSLTTGADPLFFLDYVAANRIELDQVAELVEGAAEVCREAGSRSSAGRPPSCPASTGRTSSTSRGRAWGSCRGSGDRRFSHEGGRVVGFASAGVHANGFTLVRRVLEVEDYAGTTCSRRRGSTSRTCGACASADVHGLAHVTGGGIPGNLARVLPEGLGAEIDWDAWERPQVFDWLARHVDEDELRRVFNLGIGYLAVVSDPGTSSSSGGSSARDRRARVRRGDEPAGAARRRAPVSAVASNEPGARALDRAGGRRRGGFVPARRLFRP